jgi:uncharacterized SAM-binding protein YcdF (DUF218 family)
MCYNAEMRRLLRGAGRGALLLLILAVTGFALLSWQIDRLGGVDEARPSDAIVVLGARVNQDGSPGSDLTSRTYHAVDLWKAGIAPNIICTGGFRNERLSAAAVCKRFAVSLGVPAEQVYLADGSSNTMEDAEMTAEVMTAQGWHSAVLVSHPLHLFRARWLFGRAGIEAVTSPTSTETNRIYPPLRAWYAAREAGGVVLTAINGWSIIPRQWVAKLQTWAYGSL